MTVTTNPDPITAPGSSVDVIYTIEFDPIVVGTNLSLLMVDAQLSRDGTMMTLTGPNTPGARFIFSSQITSFEMCNVGDYICTATVSLSSAQIYISGNATATGRATIDIASKNKLVLLYINVMWSFFTSQADSVNTGCSDVTRAVGLSVGLVILVEFLIALPVIAAAALCLRR